MKPYHLFIIVLLLITACSKPCLPEGSFKAKLVASFCGFHIVQVEDSNATGLGMDWTDPSGKEYKNVFTVKNPCDIANAGLKTGDSFTSQIIDIPQQVSCVICDGFMETPPLKWSIKVTK